MGLSIISGLEHRMGQVRVLGLRFLMVLSLTQHQMRLKWLGRFSVQVILFICLFQLLAMVVHLLLIMSLFTVLIGELAMGLYLMMGFL